MLNDITSKELIGISLWLMLMIFIFSLSFVPLALDKQVNVFFLDNSGNEHALVFFGFRGCSNVCPMTLLTMKQFLDSQKSTEQWPQIIFIDVDVSSDTKQASEFAKQFHSSFVGLHLPPEKLKNISTLFGLNIKQQNSHISHLGKTYLLRREVNRWALVKVYTPNSLSVEALKNEFIYSSS